MTAKGLAEAEQGFERAQAVIAQRGGLRKSTNGGWSLPADALQLEGGFESRR
jgi:hypothetical protein